MTDRAPELARPLLLVVCGLPASGKTTLARRLGVELSLPVLVRDELKTGVIATRGPGSWTDPAEHARLAVDTFGLLHAMALAALQAGCGLVVEAAYHWPIARQELAPLRSVGHLVIVECRAPVPLLRDRFAARFARGERHPAHRDQEYLDRMAADGFDWTFYDVPADIGAPVIPVDTTDGYAPGFDHLVEHIRNT